MLKCGDNLDRNVLSMNAQLELVDRMASMMSEAAAAAASSVAQRDTDIVVPQVFVEGNYLGVSDGLMEERISS